MIKGSWVQAGKKMELIIEAPVLFCDKKIKLWISAGELWSATELCPSPLPLSLSRKESPKCPEVGRINDLTYLFLLRNSVAAVLSV